MNKNCQPILRVRKPNAKRSAASKTARLEEKLDGIALLLKSATQASQVASIILNGEPQENADGVQTSSASPQRCQMTYLPEQNQTGETVAQVVREMIDSQTAANNASDSSSSSYYSTPSTTHSIPELSPSIAEEYFNNFCTYKLRHFPFVHIPPNTTAQQFSQERPFLYLCIMSTFLKSPVQQLAITDKIKAELSQKMLFNGEKSIDLLFGILVYPFWYVMQSGVNPSLLNDFSFTNHLCNKAQTSVFMHLAVSLVFDLGLHRPPSREPHLMKTFGVSDGPPGPLDLPVRTNNERRAVLGCYLLSSM